MKKSQILFLALTIPFAWGLSWPMMKLAMYHIPPLWMGDIRMFLGAIILFILLAMTNKKITLLRQEIPLLLSVGIGQMGLFTALMNLGLSRVEAGRSAILVFTTPLWITPIAVFFFKEKINFLTLVGLIVGIIGVAWLFNPFTFHWLNQTQLYGNGMLLLASMVWGGVILHIRFGVHHRSPLELLPWQMVIGGLFMAIIGLIFEPYPQISWSWSLLGEMSYLILIATVFGFWGVIELNKQLPAVTSSFLLLGVPVIGLLSSSLILGEPLTYNTLIALGLILVGLICVTASKKQIAK